ncbi:MAG: type II toxin-antitoxin system RelB/DinJ family antitoxin [Desulfobacterales bacterium]
MKTAVVRARIPEALKKEFEAAAANRGWNLSHAIRQLMNQYVAQEKEMARRREETFEALEDVEAGRVVDGPKVLNWLSGWGTADEQEPPL